MGDIISTDASSTSKNVSAASSSQCVPIFNFTEVTCAICLDNVKNRAFVNSCSHAFCLRCLLRWAKHKLECPLCKQCFSVIYYCVTSQSVFKQVPLRYLAEPSAIECSGEIGYSKSQLGRLKAVFEFADIISHDSSELRINTNQGMREDAYFFRRAIYARNYWALPELYAKKWLEPEFYVQNPEFLVTLFPWIYRELEVVLSANEHLIDQVFDLVVSLLQLYEAYSDKFVNYLKPFLGDQTQHFLHELLHFIFSRTSMPVYDKKVLYSSVYFLRGSAIKGAVMNGPGENEFITLDGDKPNVIQKEVKRCRVKSLFPSLTYADVVAITPDIHGGDRIYALDDIGGLGLDFDKLSGGQQNIDKLTGRPLNIDKVTGESLGDHHFVNCEWRSFVTNYQNRCPDESTDMLLDVIIRSSKRKNSEMS